MADGPVFARVHVLVLCDEVEELTDAEDLVNLSGIRTQLATPAFPYVHSQLCMYLQLSGHKGMASGYVVLVNGTTEEEIFQVPIEGVELSGPLEIIPAWLRLQDCEFPEPGVYWFQVFLNDKLVAERRFRVLAAGGEDNGQPPH
jgi:hypothetical protein